MTEPPVHVASVSRDRTFTARLPVGQYCLSAGGDAPRVCDAELRIAEGAGLQSTYVTHRIPKRTRCDYEAPPAGP
jgi:hypothetical protein